MPTNRTVARRTERSSASHSVRAGVRDNAVDAREAILAAATRLFAARGFEGASLQDIAEAVGVRKASLLYHFPSKDALRLAVLEALFARWNDVVPRLLLAASTGADRFDAVLRELIGFFTGEPDRARLLLREALDRPDEMRELITREVPPWMAMVAGYIRRGQEEGTVERAVDPEAYIVQVILLVVGQVASWEGIGALVEAGVGVTKRARVPAARLIAELVRMARTSLFVPSLASTSTKTRGAAPLGSAPGAIAATGGSAPNATLTAKPAMASRRSSTTRSRPATRAPRTPSSHKTRRS